MDSYYTLVRHVEENPILIALWGSDIHYDDSESWGVLKDSLLQEANHLGLSFCFIHSSFRVFLNTSALSKKFSDALHDGWWHGVQHGIGLIGHAAPLCYLQRMSFLYIAASYFKGVVVTCASDPSIDNFVRFCGTQTVHDGYIPRQEKIREIVRQHKGGMPIHLHVCWENTSGKNCCTCEKCCRTMTGLLAEGEWPSEYGFDVDEKTLLSSVHREKYTLVYGKILMPIWKSLQEEVQKNQKNIKQKGYWKYVKWMEHFDFEKADQSLGRRVRRLKRRILGKAKRMLRSNR